MVHRFLEAGGCEAKREEWAKHWQCCESVQNMEDKPWENEELKELEEGIAKAQRVRVGESIGFLQGKNRRRLRWLPPKSFPGFDKKQEERWLSSWRRWSRAESGRSEPARRCSS